MLGLKRDAGECGEARFRSFRLVLTGTLLVIAGVGAGWVDAQETTRAALGEVAPGGSDEGALASGPSRLEYKAGETWPWRIFEGLDFVEPFLPLAAASRGDVGRIVLNSALPYALLASGFALESTDQSTLAEIGRWKWVSLDEHQDNYPLLYGLIGLAAAGILLPAPEDGTGYSWKLRLDRATVFALGLGTASLETELLKPVFHRTRPNGESFGSRPSGHVTTAFSAMAFLSNVLRDTLRPQEEPNVGLRVLKEVVSALPYLGAGYMALERVHGRDHFLSDTLLGAGLGALTMDAFYASSFTRTEQARSWLGPLSITYDPVRRGIEVAIRGTF
jgi:membrane-associated phospholipid phosphatase